MRQALFISFLVIGFAVLNGCGSYESPEQRRQAANTPAGKIGQIAHKAMVQTDKAGQSLRRELGQAAREAREGWKEDARKKKQ